MKIPLAGVTLWGLVLCSSVFAEEKPAKPKELDILDQYVGHWISDVTNKPAVWDQNGTKFRTVNQAEWILDGWFLQHIGASHVVGDPDKVTKSLFLWTYDPKLHEYVAWAFQSNGKAVSSTGKWDSTSKAFTLASVKPPPSTTGTMTERFLNAKTINGKLTFIDNGGKTLMDMVWTRSRQTESEGKATREQWNQIGTPIQPLPDELKRLQPLIGEWDCEFIYAGPSVGFQSLKGKITVKWILDGRFLIVTTEQGSDHSIWIIGYDSNEKRYRQITFTNTGQIDERIGDWNGEFDTIDWKAVNKRPGSIQITQYYIGADQGKLRVNKSTHDAEGKFSQSLVIKSTRRK